MRFNEPMGEILAVRCLLLGVIYEVSVETADKECIYHEDVVAKDELDAWWKIKAEVDQANKSKWEWDDDYGWQRKEQEE